MKTLARAFGYVDRSAVREGSPLRVVMATEGRKADGIDLRMAGAQLERYRSNPVLGYGHSYWGRQNLPIGRTIPESVAVDGPLIVGDLDFDQADEFARTVERKLRDGFLNAVSIGFEVLQWESADDNMWRGGVATKWELTELSVVPVPMDADALVTAGRDHLDDRAWLAGLVDEFGADRVLRAMHRLDGGPPRPPATVPPPTDNEPPAPAGGIDQDAACRVLAAFAPKETR